MVNLVMVVSAISSSTFGAQEPMVNGVIEGDIGSIEGLGMAIDTIHRTKLIRGDE